MLNILLFVQIKERQTERILLLVQIKQRDWLKKTRNLTCFCTCNFYFLWKEARVTCWKTILSIAQV